MFGQGFNLGFFGDPPCFTDTTDIFKDNSGIALYTLDYDTSSGKDITTNTLQILGNTSCIATYKLNGGSADLSGNYNGTDANITYADGYFGQAAVFNGSSSKITFTNSAFNITTYSLSFWIYSSSYNQSQASIINMGLDNTGGAWSGLAFGVNANKVFYYGGDVTGVGGTGFFTQTGTTNITNGTWVHVAIIVNGTSITGYINGTQDTGLSRTLGANITYRAGSINTIGVRQGAFGSYGWYNGSVDQFRVFNTALSSSNITTLYNEIGERNGTPSNVDFGVGGKTLYGAKFNGSNSYVDLPLTPTFGGKNTLSVSFWFKTTTTARARMFTDYAQTSRNCDITIDGGNIEIVTDYGTTSDTHTTSLTYNNGNWHHIVVAINQSANQRTIYINGLLKDSITLPSQSWDGYGQKVTVGAFYSSSSGYSQYFDGEIDQVRIFNKALSSSEVSKLYGNGAGEIACEHTVTTTDVNYPVTNLAYYKLDNNSKDSGELRGKFNQGVTFIGNSTGIGNSTLQLSSTAHSVSLWMKPQDLTATKWQIMFFSAFSGYPSFTLGKRPDRTTSFHYRNESSQEVYFTLSNANTWYHVVVTRTNSGSTVYVNGSSVATDSNSMGTYSWGGYQKTVIGSNPLYPAEYFDGTLDQIRVYNVALTATDVANLYNNETTTTAGTLSFPTGKTAIATYKLDGNGVDVSGNYSGSEGANIVYGYDGSDTNVGYTFGKYGQAAVFNGSSSYIDLPKELADVWRAAGAFSTSLWFKRDGNQTDTTYGGRILHILDDIYIRIDIQTNNTIKALVVTSAPAYPETVSDVIPDGVWQHIVFTGDSNGIKLYLNGTLVDSDSWNGTFMTYTNTNYKFNRLGYSGSGISYLKGEIDQVRFFTSALSAENVTKLYNEKPETDTNNFKAVLWKGNGAARYISSVGFEPSLTWFKARSATYDNGLFDVLRGDGENYISSNLTSTEQIPSSNSNYGYVDLYESNGVFLGQGGNSNHPWASTNKSNVNYVAWNWKGSGFQPSQTFSNIKTQGLIAHWNATQSASLYAGSTWYDLTSNNRDLTHYKTSVANMSISRNNGGAIDMSSTRQFYRSQFVNDQTFTVGGWFRKDANNGNNATLWSQGYAPTFRLQIYGGSTGDRIYHFLHNGSTSNSYDTGIDVPKSAWFHIMVTYDLSNGTVKLYLNGTLAHTASTITGTFYSGSNSDQYFRVIRNSTNANGYLTGAVSQIRVYSDVLTATEVLNDYNATKNLFQTNNNGTISATVDANQNAGFSIVKYTGNLSAATTATGQSVGHGLSSSPELIIFKSTSNTSAWNIFSSELDNWSTRLQFDTSAKNNLYSSYPIADPTSSVFYTNYLSAQNVSGYNHIAYCFHSVSGYSKIGSYSGSGVSGKEITLDFNPSFVLIKRINATAGWTIVDDKRGTKELYPHVSNQEDTSTTNIVLETNKFTLNSTGSWYNASGGTYLYMAFK